MLAHHDLQPESIDYGYFRLRNFAAAFSRRKMIEWFCDDYQAACERYHDHLAQSGWAKYPSVVAHSFGTYLVAQAMLKYPQVRFKKVILAASILPVDFPWEDLLLRNQFESLRHEYGGHDPWPRFTSFLGKDVGPGGSEGYGGSHGHRFLEIRRELFRHSDFFTHGYMEQEWVHFLKDQSNYEVVQGAQLQSMEDFEAVAAQTLEIDDLVYGALPGYRDVRPSLDQARQWFDTEPNVYTFLFDRAIDRCIGYINALPVSPEQFSEIVASGIDDNKLVEIETFEGEAVHLYVISIAVDPRAKKPGVVPIQVELLLDGLFGKLEDLAKHRQCRVRAAAAIGWTPQGNRMCASILGMHRQGVDVAGHPIYRLDFDSQLLRRKFKALRHLYRLYQKLGLAARRAAENAQPAHAPAGSTAGEA